MENQVKSDSAAGSDGKSPLESKTFYLGILSLAAGIMGKAYPPAGEWIRSNADTLLVIFGALAPLARTGAEKPLDWKVWSISKKF